MMWGWGNKTYIGRGISCFGNKGIYFRTRELSAFSRLRSLRHFDLYLLCIGWIIRGYPKSSRGDLFYGTVAPVARLVLIKTLCILPALARIAFSADPVHGDGQIFMCFLANGTIGHGPGLKSLYNFGPGLYLFQGNGVVIGKFEQSTDGHKALGLLVDHLGELLKGFRFVVPNRFLKRGNAQRIEHMLLPIPPPTILSPDL